MVLDSPHRENEGDLIIAAEAITTAKMAFMIRHTRYKLRSAELAHAEYLIVVLSVLL